MHSICQEVGTSFLVVINGQHEGKLVEQARSLLFSWQLPIADTVVSQRTQYMDAITSGPSARKWTVWRAMWTAGSSADGPYQDLRF